MSASKKTIERPCREYLRGARCIDKVGRDHCFNCARHLDPTTLECPKGCGHSDEHDEKVLNGDS